MQLVSSKIPSNFPTCSVCIANYNGIGIIDDCINSILQQNCKFSVEIIVHDDASTDDSVNFIRKNFPEVVLIESRENVGFCVSNNRMAAKARGKYLLILNNDAMLHHDALSTLYEEAEKLHESAVLGLRQYNAQSGELIDSGIILDPFMNSIPNLDMKRTNVAMILGACIWLPKELWNKIGGFPEWFHTMHEDMYLCSMARLLGHPVRMVIESGYKHWVGKSMGGGKVAQTRLTTTYKRRELSERNRIYVMVLCYLNPLFGVVFPLHIVLLFFEGLILSLIKRDRKILTKIYFPAFKSCWQNRKKLILRRHQIQRENVISRMAFFSVFSVVPHKLKMLIKHGFPDLC
jgi:GT2 family glycosyltransferase